MTIVTIQLSPIDLYFVGKHHWKKFNHYNDDVLPGTFGINYSHLLIPKYIRIFALRLFSFYIFYFGYKKVRVSEFTTCFTTQTEIIHNRVWPYDMFCLLHLKAKMSDIFHWLNKIINTKNKSCKYTNLLCYTGNMSTSSDCNPRRCQIFTGGF